MGPAARVLIIIINIFPISRSSFFTLKEDFHVMIINLGNHYIGLQSEMNNILEFYLLYFFWSLKIGF